MLPRRAFFPWKTKSPRSTGRRAPYADLEDVMFLVRIRPKVDIGIRNGTEKQLHYFLFALLRNKTVRVVPLVERWCPGSGLDLVQKGYTIYTTSGELKIEEIVPVFNVMASNPNFSVSNFVVMAKDFEQNKFRDPSPTNVEGEMLLLNMRKDFEKYGGKGVQKRYRKYKSPTIK